MRCASLVLVLVACGASPAPVAPMRAAPARMAPTTSDAVRCKEATQARPPEVVCPACAECPQPEPPPVWDWHCLDLTLPSKKVKGYCYTQAAVCEWKRGEAKRRKWGATTACATQREAYCFMALTAYAMYRQRHCLRTAEACEHTRERIAENRAFPDETTSPCRATLNTDLFTEFEPPRTADAAQ